MLTSVEDLPGASSGNVSSLTSNDSFPGEIELSSVILVSASLAA